MRNLLGGFIIVLGMVSNAYGNSDKEKIESCEQILAAGMFNGLLEDTCGFDGQVKDQLMQFYDTAQCRYIIPQKTVDATAKAVAEDTKMRIAAFGQTTFCEVNMKHYVDLKEDMN